MRPTTSPQSWPTRQPRRFGSPPARRRLESPDGNALYAAVRYGRAGVPLTRRGPLSFRQLEGRFFPLPTVPSYSLPSYLRHDPHLPTTIDFSQSPESSPPFC